MSILITNDDGIYAEGLSVMERIARQLSDDVYVVAPQTDQSGLAHSLTLSDPLRLRQIDERHYALRGTPTDCVIMAVHHILPSPPSLVLSGVNAGGNLADDVTYSGTVAGAMEGTLLGIRSIALSQEYEYKTGEPQRCIPWDTAETHGVEIIKKLMQIPFAPGVLMNVNFPACSPSDVKRVRVTRQGRLANDIDIDKRFDGRGLPYFWMRFGRSSGITDSDTDVTACRNHEISITPLQLDLTASYMVETVSRALQ